MEIQFDRESVGLFYGMELSQIPADRWYMKLLLGKPEPPLCWLTINSIALSGHFFVGLLVFPLNYAVVENC